MARFYDTVNHAELKRVEGLLKKGGIVYTLKTAGEATEHLKEIQVAEEDMAAAETLLYGKFYPNN